MGSCVEARHARVAHHVVGALIAGRARDGLEDLCLDRRKLAVLAKVLSDLRVNVGQLHH
jgi:hypothetical protein